MKWTSALSSHESLDECVRDASEQVREGLRGTMPDLCVVFVSSAFAERYDEVPDLLGQVLPARHVLGCSGGGVIGCGREAEFVPAVSITAGVLPSVDLHLFHLEDDQLPDLDCGPDAWERALGVTAAAQPQFVIMADPYSCDVESLVMGLDYAFPRASKIGGLASDGDAPRENALFVDADVHRSGVVGCALTGNVALDTVVAQGCRPIGGPLVVTRSQRNVILEMDGQSPLDALQNIVQGLPPRDLNLMQQALFLGIGMDATRQSYAAGEYLIRNVVGIDRAHGALAVGALVRPGQVVQFHVRDAASSADDLAGVLESYKRHDRGRPSGALLFSCLGRGRHLYGRDNHDSDLFGARLGAVPLGGFFCNGEIGPVGTSGFVRTFVHGYTSCFGLFRDRSG